MAFSNTDFIIEEEKYSEEGIGNGVDDDTVAGSISVYNYSSLDISVFSVSTSILYLLMVRKADAISIYMAINEKHC